MPTNSASVSSAIEWARYPSSGRFETPIFVQAEPPD